MTRRPSRSLRRSISASRPLPLPSSSMLERRLGFLAAGAALLFALSAFGEVGVPPLKARVTDLTATLSASQVQSLESRLRDFERSKGSQIAVLMLPSTQPETI